MNQTVSKAGKALKMLAVAIAAIVAFIFAFNAFAGFLPDSIQCGLNIAICDPPPAPAYVSSMRSDLRNLVAAEELYFSENNKTFAPTLAALGTNYKATNGVTVTIGSVTATGWSATATHQSTDKTCHITLGDNSTTEGDPICK